MKITQISNNRGIIIKSSIKKVIIDGDVENASAFKDVVITHLSANTLNIIESNSSPYRRINVSFDLMQLLQKLWRNGLLKRPEVMPKFRILPTNYPSVLGLEFRITPFDNDDGLTGSFAILIEDMNTGEKLGYVPNFITQGQHRNRIKKWKKHLRDSKLNQLIMFNTNVDPDGKQVSYSEKEFKKQLTEKIKKHDNDWLQNQLVPFNPARLLTINQLAAENNNPIIWLPAYARLLHYYYPDEDWLYQSDQLPDDLKEFFEKAPHLVAANQQDSDGILQSKSIIPLNQHLSEYAAQFKHTLPQNDLTEIMQIIGAQETYLI